MLSLLKSFLFEDFRMVCLTRPAVQTSWTNLCRVERPRQLFRAASPVARLIRLLTDGAPFSSLLSLRCSFSLHSSNFATRLSPANHSTINDMMKYHGHEESRLRGGDLAMPVNKQGGRWQLDKSEQPGLCRTE